VPFVTKISNTYDYCVNKAIPDGSNLYYATLFEKEKNKAIIISLHAFLYELADIIKECSDPGVARIKLHWWQEEIERLFQQEPRHPITKYLKEFTTLNENLRASLNSIINNFDNFLFIQKTNNLKSILVLYDLTAGEVWHLCGIQLGATDASSLQSYRNIGTVYHFISSLQEPNTYITESRCIIPENVIQHGDLLNNKFQLKNNSINQADIFSPLMKELKILLEKDYHDLKENDFSALKQGLILNRLAFKTCDEIINGGCKLLSTYTSLTPLRKLWIAWRSHLIL